MEHKVVGVYAPHKPNYDHLLVVVEEMRKLGSPTIHVVSHKGSVLAIEGSHRLCAAYLLDIPVKIVKVALDFCLIPNRPAKVVLDRWNWGKNNAYYIVKVAK